MLSEDDGNFEIGQSSTGMFLEVKQIVSSWQDVDGVSQHRTLQQSEMWDDGAACWVSIVAAQRDLKSALASHGACYILHGIRLPHEYCAMCSLLQRLMESLPFLAHQFVSVHGHFSGST